VGLCFHVGECQVVDGVRCSSLSRSQLPLTTDHAGDP
jgi:hypothetical protein